MRVTAKATFIHGSKEFRRGATVDIAAATAESLMKAGLVREATKVDEKPAALAAATPAAKSVATKADAKE